MHHHARTKFYPHRQLPAAGHSTVGQRANLGRRQRPLSTYVASVGTKLYQPNDTLTEAEGLARNGYMMGAYAGSF
jgi:hypothetical protein